MVVSALRRLCVPFLVVAIAIALLALSSGGSKAQWIPGTPQFETNNDIRLCNVFPDTVFGGPDGDVPILEGAGPDCDPNADPDGAGPLEPGTTPYDPTKTEDGSGTCANGVDDDTANGIDQADPSCDPGGGYDPSLNEGGVSTPATCDDNEDNSDWADDGIENDSGDTEKDDADPDCLGHPDIGVIFNVPFGHLNYNQGSYVTQVKDVIPGDQSAIPLGTVMGGLKSVTTLGLATGSCGSTIFPTFLWFKASIDINDVFVVSPEGTGDRFLTMANEIPGDPTNPTGRDDEAPFGVADSNANTVTKYPDIYNRFFDPDGSGGGPTVPHLPWLGEDPLAVNGIPETVLDGLDDDLDGLIDEGAYGSCGDGQDNQALDDPIGPLADGADANDPDCIDVSPYDPVQPTYRNSGLTQVPPGGEWQSLTTLGFDAGELQAAFSANPDTSTHPFAKLDVSVGDTSVTVLNDPTATAISVNPISDYCTPLGTLTVVLGMVDTDGDDIGDTPTGSAPASSEHAAMSRTQSTRDADGDGLENAIDTCAWIANTPAEDPYTSTGPDADMLDSVCDPFPATPDPDEDGDDFLNNQDVCPLHFVADPTLQLDSELDEEFVDGSPDGGPLGDSIGDACDGVFHAKYNPSTLGDHLVADGLYFNTFYVDSVCITSAGYTDVDGDGWCGGNGTDGTPGTPDDGSDTNDNDANVNPGGTFSLKMPADSSDITDTDNTENQNCRDGLDNDGDTDVDNDDTECTNFVGLESDGPADPSPEVGPCDDTIDNDGDTSADGADSTDCLADWYEWKIGIDPMNDCPIIKGHDAWRPDFDGDGLVNIVDLNKLLPPPLGVWGGKPGVGQGPYSVRRDIGHATDPSGNGPDGVINIVDLNKLLPYPLGSWGFSCTP